MGIIDWAADKVQSVTGEKERRQLVVKIREFFIEAKEKVEELIAKLNDVIKVFNSKILNINNFRQTKVKQNIDRLSDFLSNFGTIKPMSEYADEKEKNLEKIPERSFETIEDYIKGVDWSSDEVFYNTFLLTPVGMMFKTKKQNLAMTERLEELKLSFEKMEQDIKNKMSMMEKVDIAILDIYCTNVLFISNFIDNKIVPQLQLIESFLQADSIKNYIVADRELVNVDLKNNIMLYEGSLYHKHYIFIKNVFLFYIISVKIYTTPVLTKILENKKLTKKDLLIVESHSSLVLSQAETINKSM